MTNNNKKILISSTESKQAGFVLLYAVLVTLVVVTVGVIIMNIITKQIILSSIGKNSQLAAYASISGVECAKYWRSSSNLPFGSLGITSNPDGTESESFTPPSGPVTIYCSEADDITLPYDGNPDEFRGSWTIEFNWGGCANIEVVHNIQGMTIQSSGYNVGSKNNCPGSSPRLTERTILIEPQATP